MADNLVYQTEKVLKEQADKIDSGKKAGVEEAVEKVKKSLASENVEEIEAAMEGLNTAMQAISADLYSQAKSGAEQAGAAGAEGQPAEGAGETEEKATTSKSDDKGDVIDADFEMVDDDKKK